MYCQISSSDRHSSLNSPDSLFPVSRPTAQSFLKPSGGAEGYGFPRKRGVKELSKSLKSHHCSVGVNSVWYAYVELCRSWNNRSAKVRCVPRAHMTTAENSEKANSGMVYRLEQNPPLCSRETRPENCSTLSIHAVWLREIPPITRSSYVCICGAARNGASKSAVMTRTRSVAQAANTSSCSKNENMLRVISHTCIDNKEKNT